MRFEAALAFALDSPGKMRKRIDDASHYHLPTGNRQRPKAISGNEYTGLACLFAQELRYRASYIAWLCACRESLLLNKYAALSSYILLRKAPKARDMR